ASVSYSFSVIESDIISSVYPNPATEGQTCYIDYILTRDHPNGNIFLYDVGGRKVFSRPMNAAELSAGSHQLSFPYLSGHLSSGLYIFVLRTGDTQLSKKMTFFK
ncbi:MAG: T9SS type A sorting domain-containing protein, partial [FCB group bacterium]|nr:T9SS type A sorting domain-containing protein [FCB group bacterium]